MIFDFFRQYFSRKRLSLIEALAAMLGENQLKTIFEQTHDRRELIQVSSAISRIPEESLTEAVAKKMKIEYSRFVPTMNLASLPSSIEVQHFLSAAAILDTTDPSLKTIYCVEPRLVENVFGGLTRTKFILASWTSIRDAILRSETDLYHSCEASTFNKDEFIVDGLAHVEDILINSLHLDAVSIEFDLSLHNPGYTFTVPGKNKMQNRLSPAIAQSIRGFLSDFSSDSELVVNDQVYDLLIEENYALFLKKHNDINSNNGKVIDFPSERLKKSDLPEVPNLKVEESPSPTTKTLSIDNEIHILLAEDNAEFAKVLTRLFEREGYRVSHASNGLEALEILNYMPQEPLIVVTDLHMPKKNGLELTYSVRANQTHGTAPIIVLTSDDETEQHISLLEAGADAFIGKGADHKILLAQIHSFASRIKSKKIA